MLVINILVDFLNLVVGIRLFIILFFILLVIAEYFLKKIT